MKCKILAQIVNMTENLELLKTDWAEMAKARYLYLKYKHCIHVY